MKILCVGSVPVTALFHSSDRPSLSLYYLLRLSDMDSGIDSRYAFFDVGRTRRESHTSRGQQKNKRWHIQGQGKIQTSDPCVRVAQDYAFTLWTSSKEHINHGESKCKRVIWTLNPFVLLQFRRFVCPCNRSHEESRGEILTWATETTFQLLFFFHSGPFLCTFHREMHWDSFFF
jgi:hypothetical protein